MSDDSDQQSAVNEQKVIDAQQAAPATRTEKEQGQAAADFASKKGSDGKTMRVKVYSPFRSYFDGLALSISAVNGTGPFDILPKHHNFISLLNACDLIVRTKEGARKIIISGGIMHVRADQVIVFLDV
ncbi:MAG TPA: hypothetical protein VHA05_03130 [Candidatus Saccharimonadales bacterium]|nr:hypothetical protein [Candidatus Saccharimonadales bacterium]